MGLSPKIIEKLERQIGWARSGRTNTIDANTLEPMERHMSVYPREALDCANLLEFAQDPAVTRSEAATIGEEAAAMLPTGAVSFIIPVRIVAAACSLARSIYWSARDEKPDGLPAENQQP